jgi:hypothetical protein
MCPLPHKLLLSGVKEMTHKEVSIEVSSYMLHEIALHVSKHTMVVTTH